MVILPCGDFVAVQMLHFCHKILVDFRVSYNNKEWNVIFLKNGFCSNDINHSPYLSNDIELNLKAFH